MQELELIRELYQNNKLDLITIITWVTQGYIS